MRRAIVYHRGGEVAVLITLLPSEKRKPDRRRVLYCVTVLSVHRLAAAALAYHVPLREARRRLAEHWGIPPELLEPAT